MSEKDFGSTSKPGVRALPGGATEASRKVETAPSPEHTKHASTKRDALGFGFEVPPVLTTAGSILKSDGLGKWMLTVPSVAAPARLKAHEIEPSNTNQVV